MRIIKDPPKILLESDLYQTGDIIKMPENFREFFAIESQKDDVYEAFERSVENLYRMMEQFYAEAGPIQWGGDDSSNFADLPATPRKGHPFGHDINTYLKNIPKYAHAQAVDNRYTMDPENSRYTGQGMMGALAAQHRGEKVGNWTAEIRWTKQGLPQSNIIDPHTLKRIPLVGAHTRRPIKEGEENPNPPKENAYTPAEPLGPNVSYKDRGGWHARNGVYTGFGTNVLNALGTPTGQPRDLKPWLATGPGAQIGKADKLGYPSSKSVGRIGADLSAPIPDDAQTGGYTGGPGMPPGTRGFRKSTIGGAAGRTMTGMVRGPFHDPALYDPRAINRAKDLGKLKTRVAPLTGKRALTRDPTPEEAEADRAKGLEPQKRYRKRQWIQDPNNPTDPTAKILEPAPSAIYDDEELGQMQARYMSQSKDAKEAGRDKAAAFYDRMAAQIQQELRHRKSERENPSDRKGKPTGWNPRGVGRTIIDPLPQGRGGTLLQWDPASAKKDGKGPKQLDANGEPTGLRYDRTMPVKVRDQKYKTDPATGGLMPDGPAGPEKKIDTDYYGPMTKEKKLEAVYNLYPAPGEPIVVSDKFKKDWMSHSNGGSTRITGKELVPYTDADKVFLQYNPSANFMINDDGTFVARKKEAQPKEGEEEIEEATKSPSPKAGSAIYYWAKVDDNKEVVFVYKKDTKLRSQPMYYPGRMDDRKTGKATLFGGIQAHAPNNAEHIPYEDKEQHKEAAASWTQVMSQEIPQGVEEGLKEIKGKGVSDETIEEFRLMTDDFSQSAYNYLYHNLKNPKTLDTKHGHQVHFDFDYIHQHFPHLYAAIKQMDNWLAKGGGEKLGITKPFSRMSMLEISDVLEKIRESGDDEPMFQTKVQSKHLKGDLPMFIASQDKGGNEIPSTGRTVRDRDGDEYEEKGRKGYVTLDVFGDTLYFMLDEARRYYFRMAAKDMVVKVWQSEYRRRKGEQSGGIDNNMIDGTRAIAMRGEEAVKNGRGHHIYKNIIHQFNALKRNEYSRVVKEMDKAFNDYKEDPLDMDKRADYEAAKHRLSSANLRVAAIDKLNKEANDKLEKGEITEDQAAEYVVKNLNRVVEEARQSALRGRNFRNVAQRTEIAPISPEEALANIQEEYPNEINNNDSGWVQIGNELGSGNTKAIQQAAQQVESDPKVSATADAVIRYHALKTLMSNYKKMDEQTKKSVRRVVARLHDLAILVDFTEQATKLLGEADAEQAATPTTKSGLRGKVRKS